MRFGVLHTENFIVLMYHNCWFLLFSIPSVDSFSVLSLVIESVSTPHAIVPFEMLIVVERVVLCLVQ